MKASSFVGGIGKAFTIAFLAVLALAVLYPLLWMVLNGFKTNAQLFGDPFALPTQFTFENYIKAWDRGVKDYVAVSALVTITSTICTVLISAWAAFGLTRVHLPFNRVITVIILSGLMLAPAVTLIPLVQMMQRMGLYNTWWALLILYTAFRVPFTTFLIRAYMVDLPREVDEAAAIDGASKARTFWQIILPMCRPILISTVLLHILFSWNEYLFAMVFLGGGEVQTLPVGLTKLMGREATDYPIVFAGMVMAALPVLILFFAGQRYFVRGLADGMGK